MTADTAEETALRRERRHRGWTAERTLQEMRDNGWEQHSTDESAKRSLLRWETGQQPEERTQAALAKVYRLPVYTLFPVDRPETEPDIDPLELVERISAGSLNDTTIDDLAAHVEQLCVRYSTDNPRLVLGEAAQIFSKITAALAEPVNATQHLALVDQSSWLALLAGCLYNDLGDRPRAEAMRLQAGQLARDARNDVTHAWSHEMVVWFNLTDGEYEAAISAAEAGQQIAPATDVAVQLAGQEAEAWARLGEPDRAQAALDRGRAIVDTLPYPRNPRHHFTVDPLKFRKPLMRVARFNGDLAEAEHQANEIITQGRRPDGTDRQPMRRADSLGALAACAATTGDVDTAVAYAHEALDVPRISKPSLLLVVGEAVGEMPDNHPAVEGLTERVRELAAV